MSLVTRLTENNESSLALFPVPMPSERTIYFSLTLESKTSKLSPEYSPLDVTYTFRAQIEAYEAAGAAPTVVYGTSSFTKKVILFGSDGGTQRFSTCEADQIVTTSPTSGCSCCCCTAAMPCASVSVAAPMCLDAKLVAEPAPSEEKNVLITIGLFAIIQLSRPVPIMVPVYDYCVPGKECSTNSDSPCEMFEKIAFPTVEFFPRGLEEPNCKEENDTEGQGEAQG